MKKIYFLISAVAVAVDQFTKYLITTRIRPHSAVDVTSFFRIVNVTNKGAAFGSFQNLGNPFFIAISVFAIAVVVFLIFTGRENPLGLSLILGGAIGNLIDRLRFGHVVDFLDVYAGRYHWPAFNAADSFLSIGIVLMLAYYLFRGNRT